MPAGGGGSKINLVLVGFMGSGKTAVGRELARRLRRSFVDTDDLVAGYAGLSIEDIFRSLGESGFRELETRAVIEVAEQDGLVVATGGGVLTHLENMFNLRRNGYLVWLRASPETILRRVGTGSEPETAGGRPLLAGGDDRDRMAAIRRLLAEREPMYTVADLVVDTDGKDVASVVEEIVELLVRLGLIGEVRGEREREA